MRTSTAGSPGGHVVVALPGNWRHDRPKASYAVTEVNPEFRGTGFFESLGLPGFVTYLTIAAEILDGLALLAGVGTRYVALALVPVLLGAAWLVHAGNGWLFSNEGGGWEFPVYWAVTLLALAALGDGAFSLRALKSGRTVTG
jgi:uncharacterized membrane protein YphA (DoxX/SURF4 family)